MPTALDNRYILRRPAKNVIELGVAVSDIVIMITIKAVFKLPLCTGSHDSVDLEHEIDVSNTASS